MAGNSAADARRYSRFNSYQLRLMEPATECIAHSYSGTHQLLTGHKYTTFHVNLQYSNYPLSVTTP